MHWVASVHYNDDPYEPELKLGIEGTAEGFLAVDGEGELISTESCFTEEDVCALIEEFYGHYNTFRWLNS
jgi:hypothetical protein